MVLDAIRIQAGPDVGRPLEGIVPVLLQDRSRSRLVVPVDARREMVEAGLLALEERQVVAPEPPHLAPLAHVADHSRTE